MNRVRCAIYTRKSSEEGLEQSFNSLDAQREACAAYILSQASEGWSMNSEEYDDGGISGGTLDRPALQRLLGDIAAGRIDIVVVYKVDRLTRSLLDFSKLVEAFDKAGTSFVSITQSFNTTTSMGRLTLNMLLSFAQFEREVTAERIRDKIAASKARGMWMGGTPPTGYAKNDRTLAIVPEEAEFVRHIFARYLDVGNVRSLADDLARQGTKGPVRIYASGRRAGGTPLSRGQLYHLLNNPIYIGRIRHHEKTYAGLHPAIIDLATWDAVQAQLAENTQGTARQRANRPSLLAGLIRDDKGEPLIASHACKAAPGKTRSGTVRYRYYISRWAAEGVVKGESAIRIPAAEVESAVIDQLAGALGDPIDIIARLGAPLDASALGAISSAAGKLAGKVRSGEREAVRALVAAVRVLRNEIQIDLNAGNLAMVLGIEPGTSEVVTLNSPTRLTRTGHTMRVIQTDRVRTPEKRPRENLLRLLVKGRGWWEWLAQGDIDIATIAREEGLTASYVTRVTRLAFLSPTVVDAIIAGAQPVALEAGLLRAPGLPASWAEQERVFLTV